MVDEKFLPYFEKYLPFPCEYKQEGAYSFRKFLNSDLDSSLWNILVYKVHPKFLHIIRDNESLAGKYPYLPCSMLIVLEKDKIKDVFYQPWYS